MQFSRKLILPLFGLILLVVGMSFFERVPVREVLAQEIINTPTFIFLRDLREGDTGNDVFELQKILNSDGATRISDSGVGSPGNETNYFGSGTRSSVIRFQNKYADEILRPSGMSESSGFVGLWTRLKLNQIILNASVGQFPTPTLPSAPAISSNLPISQTSSIPPVSSIPSTSPIPTTNQLSALVASEELSISFPSKYFGPVGTSVTLSGTGFSTTANTISFGNEFRIEKLPAKNTNELTFIVPSQVRPGRYDVSISNDKSGSSSSRSTSRTNSNKRATSVASLTSFPFMVTATIGVEPIVEKVEPAQAIFGEKITVTGQNFTETGNIVSTSVGIFKDLRSADGKTLTFSIPLPDYLEENDDPRLRKIQFREKDNLYWPVWIRVVNLNGMSESTEKGKFLLNI